MNKDRLLKLADLLEADAKNPKGIQFDLGGWGNTEDGTTPGIDCGTTACAVGLACLSPELQAEGLSFTTDRDEDTDDGSTLVFLDPQYEDCHGWRAVRRFFEITEATADDLFNWGSYDVRYGAEAELAVAARIRELVGSQ